MPTGHRGDRLLRRHRAVELDLCLRFEPRQPRRLLPLHARRERGDHVHSDLPRCRGGELYLWDGDRQIDEHSSNTASCLNRCAQITRWLTKGKTYTIEVTSDGASTGRYLLALRRTLLLTESTRAPADAPTECRETVTVERGPRFGRNASGVFGWPCHSVAKAGHYARYYTFTLSEARDVRIELYSSQAAGASLYLRGGNLGSGPHMGMSHNPAETAVRARMDGRLPAGTYTIEAVAAGPGDGGIFNIVVKQGPPSWQPPDECVHQISVTRTWTRGHSRRRRGRMGRALLLQCPPRPPCPVVQLHAGSGGYGAVRAVRR